MPLQNQSHKALSTAQQNRARTSMKERDSRRAEREARLSVQSCCNHMKEGSGANRDHQVVEANSSSKPARVASRRERESEEPKRARTVVTARVVAGRERGLRREADRVGPRWAQRVGRRVGNAHVRATAPHAHKTRLGSERPSEAAQQHTKTRTQTTNGERCDVKKPQARAIRLRRHE